MPTIDPTMYQAMAIKHALMLYAKTGIKANRMYTPTRMMASAAKITGKTFKARDYTAAADALSAWVAARGK